MSTKQVPFTLLSQNIAMVLMEQYNYDKADASALFALTSLMDDYAKELAVQIKANAELNDRSQPNLLDTLMAADEYGMDKEAQMKFMHAKM